MVDSAPPPGASPLRGKCWRGAGGWRLCVSADGAERLTARLWRAPATAVRFAPAPRGRGAARPYPRTPTRGKLSLQAFARCRARAALRAGGFVLAHGATRPCARWWRAPAAPLALLAVPGERGYSPLPPVPYPRQAELAGFCALSRACCASRRCVLCWRTVRPAVFCAGARSHPPVCAVFFGLFWVDSSAVKG